MKRSIVPVLLSILFLAACNEDPNRSDAYGNFEVEDVMISAEGQGRLLSFDINEGDMLKAGQLVGVIDTLQLDLKRKQMESMVRTVDTRTHTLKANIQAQNVQLANLEREHRRIINLFEDGAATQKQKEDIEGSIAAMEAQINVLKSQAGTIAAERSSLQIQIAQLEEQISRSIITNPINGVVLQKYKQAGEIVAPGVSLYKIADLSELILRAYISGDQLSKISIGETLIVRVDGPEEIMELEGKVRWISSQAEFTPKIIQTREERVNLVYAVKVSVVNDGCLKIGMPGEIKFK